MIFFAYKSPNFHPKLSYPGTKILILFQLKEKLCCHAVCVLCHCVKLCVKHNCVKVLCLRQCQADADLILFQLKKKELTQ